MAVGVRHRVGHHATVRETTAVDALAVDAILRSHTLNDSQQEFRVEVLLTVGTPAIGRHTTQARERRGQSLRIGHDKALHVGYGMEIRVVRCGGHRAASTMQRENQRCILLHIAGNIEQVLASLISHIQIHEIVELRSHQQLRKA